MSNNSKKSDSKQRQFGIFPTFDVAAFKSALRQAIKRSGASRAQIADRATAFCGRSVTVAQIDAWTADSKPHLPRADELAALVAATGRPEPVDAIGAPAGVRAIGAADAQLLEIAQLKEERDEINQRLDRLSTLRRGSK